MKYYLVIPARYQSKRLPGKPLIDIDGLPMIIRTYNQCKKVIPKSKILVATDDKRIEKVCKRKYIKTVIWLTLMKKLLCREEMFFIKVR